MSGQAALDVHANIVHAPCVLGTPLTCSLLSLRSLVYLFMFVEVASLKQ